jgi:hypothetical protein
MKLNPLSTAVDSSASTLKVNTAVSVEAVKDWDVHAIIFDIVVPVPNPFRFPCGPRKFVTEIL